MKYWTAIKILFVVVFLNIGCKKQDAVLFDIELMPTFESPAGLTALETHYFVMYDVQSQYTERLLASGLKDSDVKTIKPASGAILSLDQNVNYGYIQEVSILVSSTDNFTREAFYSIQVPFDAGNAISLAGTLPDFKDILKNARCNLRVGLKLRADSPATFVNRLKLKFVAQ